MYLAGMCSENRSFLKVGLGEMRRSLMEREGRHSGISDFWGVSMPGWKTEKMKGLNTSSFQQVMGMATRFQRTGAGCHP